MIVLIDARDNVARKWTQVHDYLNSGNTHTEKVHMCPHHSSYVRAARGASNGFEL